MLDGRGRADLGPDEWLIGISSWVIEDGNYDDFEVGELRPFALEFHDLGLTAAGDNDLASASLGAGRYAVRAETVFVGREVMILDLGLLAYTDSGPSNVSSGDRVSGEILLEVDHYSYFERHAKLEGVPPLIYRWAITGIWCQTAPIIEVPGPRGPILQRDPDRLGYRSLGRTGRHAGFNAEYLLRCRLQPDPPTHRL